MKVWGILAVIIGVALILYAYGAPSAPDYARTVNYEMMLMKTLHAIAGAGCLAAGAIWTAVGVVLDRLPPVAATPDADADATQAKADLPFNRIDSES